MQTTVSYCHGQFPCISYLVALLALKFGEQPHTRRRYVAVPQKEGGAAAC